MKQKILKGKGEFLYDFKQDVLLFKMKDRDYKRSIEFQNFVADLDTDNFVTGVRIFDVSKVFNVDKYFLKSIVDVKFKADVEKNVVTIVIQFVSKVRNKVFPLIKQEERFGQQFTTPIGSMKIEDSRVECLAIV